METVKYLQIVDNFHFDSLIQKWYSSIDFKSENLIDNFYSWAFVYFFLNVSLQHA